MYAHNNFFVKTKLKTINSIYKNMNLRNLR